MKKIFREPINTVTHLVGAILSVLGLIVLLVYTIKYNSSLTNIISIIIFGISMILLYLASSIYHMVKGSEKLICFLKKVDHSMIFVLIAGTYTPFCILGLSGAWKWTLISIIWSFAFVGVMLSIFYINMPRYIKTTIYIIIGWLGLVAIYPLYLSLSFDGVFYLLLGGIIYTVGGIIYALKKPNISLHFGFHELFHIFVLIGTFLHFWVVLKYLVLQ